jgi:2-dehydropantoate 2-reductase
MAAWLGRTGEHEVILCSRRPLAEITVETPGEVIVAHPQVLTNPREAMPVDWVLVTTKAYDAAATAQWLANLAAQGAPVAVLQNGVEHRERFAPWLPAAQILPVLVYCPAERTVPTRMVQRRAARLVVPDDAQGRAFAALFAGTPVKVETTPDITTALWQKLLLNSSGILTALLLQPNGIFHDKQICLAARDIMLECIAVGRAEGAVLDEAMMDGCLAVYQNGARDGMNSLHADRVAGRPLELDARNGVIVRLGIKHGIPTPCNRLALTLLEALVNPVA